MKFRVVRDEFADAVAWDREFGRVRDVSRLGVERNLFRYRPVPVAVRATGEALEIEAGVVASEPALCALLEAQGLDHERHSLRLPVRSLAWSIDGDVLTLSFELPRGAFATSVLHEIVRDAWHDVD